MRPCLTLFPTNRPKPPAPPNQQNGRSRPLPLTLKSAETARQVLLFSVAYYVTARGQTYYSNYVIER